MKTLDIYLDSGEIKTVKVYKGFELYGLTFVANREVIDKDRQGDTWTLTETSSTGAVIVYCRTRREAIARGMDRLMLAGEKKTKELVKQTIKKYQGGHNGKKTFSQKLLEMEEEDRSHREKERERIIPYKPLEALYEEWADWWENEPNKQFVAVK